MNSLVKDKGKLFLIPNTLGSDANLNRVLPLSVEDNVRELTHFIVENEKAARRFIKLLVPAIPQSSLQFYTLDKHKDKKDFSTYLQPCLDGINMGLLSDAGCPAVADPGAYIVRMAHLHSIKVVPLVGPSSILLAVMASGLNGQNFCFNGYLPIDQSQLKSELKFLDRISAERQQTQIFIETPYRNEKLFDNLVKHLHPSTNLCIATDLTLESETIQTKSISEWKKEKVNLHKRPSIFLFLKPN